MMERRSDQVIEKLRRWTHFRVHAETDENGRISMSNDLAVMLEDLCGEAANMIEELRDMKEKTEMSNMPPFGSYGDSVDPADVISRHEAIREIKQIVSPCGEAGNGDAISREVVLAKLRNLKKPEQGADPGYPPFGSYGDSVTIDEILKRTEPEQYVSRLPTANPTYGDNCWARLPCGICRNTMMQCPLSVMQPAWTCSSSTATNQTGGDA